MSSITKQKNIPSGWELKKLDKYIEEGSIRLGRGNVISKIDIAANPGSNPIYSSSVQRGGLFGTYGDYMFDEELITWSIDGGGNFFYRPRHKFSVTNVSGILRADADKFNYRFLSYLLEWEHRNFNFDYQSKAHPSVIRLLYFISRPPLLEQIKIAEILAAVDDEIQKTDEIIFATQKLKRGLMQTLFARGIGHTKFKNTAVGQVPVEWEVKPLGQLRKSITSGSRGWAKYYSDSGAIFIRIGNLSRHNTDLKLNEIQYVQPPEGGEGVRTKTKSGDVLISITADLGLIALVPETLGDAYVNQHIALVRFDDTKSLAPWIAHYLRTPAAQKQFGGFNDAGAKAGLNLPTIDRVLVPLPASPTERNKIVEMVTAIESKVNINKKFKEKLTLLKKGLMQDLLSGKVRVTS